MAKLGAVRLVLSSLPWLETGSRPNWGEMCHFLSSTHYSFFVSLCVCVCRCADLCLCCQFPPLIVSPSSFPSWWAHRVFIMLNFFLYSFTRNLNSSYDLSVFKDAVQSRWIWKSPSPHRNASQRRYMRKDPGVPMSRRVILLLLRSPSHFQA